MSIIASIHGRAARDAELRQSHAGKPWCRVSVACAAGVDRENGETLSAIGRVEVNKWRGQDGQEREDLQLIADAIVTADCAGPGGRKPKGNGDRRDYSGSHRAIPIGRCTVR